MSAFDDEHGLWLYEERKEPSQRPKPLQMKSLRKYLDMKTRRPMTMHERESLRALIEWYEHEL